MRRIHTTHCRQPARAGLVAVLGAMTALTTAVVGAADLQWDRRYAAALNQSEWTVERDAGSCHLLHPIPRFGLAVFSRSADGDQALRIYTHRPPRNSRTVELWSEPTEWRNGVLRRVGFTRALDDPRTFLLNHAMANRVLQELERGQRPVMTFQDWHAPGEDVALALSNAGFRPMYQRYLACAGDLQRRAPAPDGPADGPADAPASARTNVPAVAVAAEVVPTLRPAPPSSGLLARHGQTPPPAPPASEAAETGATDRGDEAGGKRPVHFVFDDTGLTRTERDYLQGFLERLDDDHDTITVTGHTDNVGDPDYNRRLGAARAAAVRDYLVRHGVDPDRITVTSAGEDSPTMDNDMDDGRAANRRASLHLEP